MNSEKPWRHYVDKAEQYKALGQIDHYLYQQAGDDYPWEFAVKCEPGAGHRLEIATSVRFIAQHPCGLSFSWSFDIEPRSANGQGFYEIDVPGCLQVLAAIPKAAAVSFRKYLADCAIAVQKNADKYQEIAFRESATAGQLRVLGNTKQA